MQVSGSRDVIGLATIIWLLLSPTQESDSESVTSKDARIVSLADWGRVVLRCQTAAKHQAGDIARRRFILPPWSKIKEIKGEEGK